MDIETKVCVREENINFLHLVVDDLREYGNKVLSERKGVCIRDAKDYLNLTIIPALKRGEVTGQKYLDLFSGKIPFWCGRGREFYINPENGKKRFTIKTKFFRQVKPCVVLDEEVNYEILMHN